MSVFGETYTDDSVTWCDVHAISRQDCGCRAPGDDGLLEAIRSGSWLHAQTFQPVRYAVPHLFTEGYNVLIGGPKKGKSWLMLHCCLAVADEGIALGAIPVSGGKVLYLALEDGDRRLQDRIHKLRGTGPFPERFHYATRIEPGQILRTIRAWLERHPDTALIVLDTLGKVLPPAKRGETTYERDYRIGSALKGLVDDYPGLALVVVHHDRKAKTSDFVDSVSGTNGVAGAADTIIALARERHSTEGLLAVTGRDIREAEYAITLRDGVTWQLLGGSLEAAAAGASDVRQEVKASNLGATMQQVVDYVKSHPPSVRAAEVATALGMESSKASVYLNRAAESRLIDKQERGRFGPIVSSVVVYGVFEGLDTTNTPNRTHTTAGTAVM